MDLFEYQGRKLFQDVAKFELSKSELVDINSTHNLEKVCENLSFPLICKAQVKVGGRGKLGGVKLADSFEDVKRILNDFKTLEIKGNKIQTALIVEASKIVNEFYLSCLFDRAEKSAVLVFSQFGGVEIEEVAKTDPEKISKLNFFCSAHHFPKLDELEEFFNNSLKNSAFNFSVDFNLVQELAKTAQKVIEMFDQIEATLVEINPLAVVETENGLKIEPLDSKITLDDNSFFRNEFAKEFLKDENSELRSNSRETLAKAKGLAYVELDGTVGIIGNGAGLVMSSVDAVNFAGAKPANFLDIGGGASSEHMQNAIELVLNNPLVNVLLINVFGGLTQCDLVANGILKAIDNLKNFQKLSPIVVRFAGNAADDGLQILDNASKQDDFLQSKLKFTASFEEAVRIAAKESGEICE